MGASAAGLVVAQAASAVAAPVSGQQSAGQQPLSAAAAAQLSRNVTQRVIVFLKNEPGMASARSAAMSARSAAIATSQRPLMSELSQVHATHVTGYRLVNAVAATVSAGEEARLRANPAVAQVIPDSIIPAPTSSPFAAGGPDTSTAGVKAFDNSCLPHGRVQLEPEALQVTHTASLSKTAKTARSLGITGSGVTVAWIADGIDPHNINFIRKNGKSAFTDYKDFSGDGTTAPTTGGEAFLDANSIAGQGRHVYNLQHFAARPLSAPCNVRIEGVAPGANLVGLKVFGAAGAPLSNFLDAINYATVVNPVNVINESFGGNPIPDTAVDATREFDDAAIAAGITVAVSTGDAGITNTIGSPATDPQVISAGASTDFRAYGPGQANGADIFAKGFLDNNIATFSSAGFDETGHTVDLVAPGDSSFTSCDANLKKFDECSNFKGQASPVQFTGGTSQSSPLTAGAAALVIQAYRKTHGGANPSPALVKQILLSTATNLGAPASEQGAGLLNTFKAVQAAESVKVNGLGTPTGRTLLTSANQVNFAAGPRTGEHRTVTVTNTGAAAQTVHVSGRTLGKSSQIARATVTLRNKTSRHFIDQSGFPDNFAEVHFRVGKHVNRLSTSIGYRASNSTFNAAVRMILVSPGGKLAANDLPQGLSNFGQADVVNPAAGRWTAVIFSIEGGKNLQGTTGKVLFAAHTQRTTSFGSLSRHTLRIPAGGQASFTFRKATPASPGDAAGSIVLNAGSGATSIPVTLRSRVRVSAGHPGSFSGTMTSGNGRGSNGQESFYEFGVPAGTASVSVSVTLANDPGNFYNAYLIDPHGQMQGIGSNFLQTSPTAFSPTRSLTAFADHPVAGTWTLVIEFDAPSAGNEITDHFTGRVSFSSGVKVTHAGLPQSTSVTLSATKKVSVKITNNSKAPEDFFLDPRLNGSATATLAEQTGFSNAPVPFDGSAVAEWLVPPHATNLVTTGNATVPVTFDMSPFLGDPDVFSGAPSMTPSTTIPAAPGDTLSPGGWVAVAQIGATNGFVSPAPGGGVVSSMTTTATMQPFDPSVTSNVGDWWQFSVNLSNGFGLFQIKPGQTRTITLTINPANAASTTVQGSLYLDDFVSAPGNNSGSEIIKIPYAYTAGG
ncbi:MAG TPA: S8 family serine peptidase [Streptosporangiaceae bacterium]